MTTTLNTQIQIQPFEKTKMDDSQTLILCTHMAFVMVGLVNLIRALIHYYSDLGVIIPIIEGVQFIISLALWLIFLKFKNAETIYPLQLILSYIGLSIALILDGGLNFITNAFWMAIICPAAIVCKFVKLSKIMLILTLISIAIHASRFFSIMQPVEMSYVLDSFLFIISCGVALFLIIKSYNKFLARVHQFEADLHEKSNKTLVDKINEVTKQLQYAQRQMIVNEKMMSLGLLVSSVSHDINSPISSIKTSAANILSAVNELTKSFKESGYNISKEMREIIAELVYSIINNSNILSSREEREITNKISKQLDALQISIDDDICIMLAQIGISDNIDKYIPLLQHEHADFLLKSIMHVFEAISNTKNISQSVDMAAKIVYTLKSFTRTDINEPSTQIDVASSIETVLGMYGNKLKNNINVIKNYDYDIQIYGKLDEIQQIWINIIFNSMQAMNMKGDLTIAMSIVNHNDGNTINDDILNPGSKYVRVDIADTGCGIDESISERIFEPLFTTKPEGEGSGLGLSIVNKIIKKHNGYITFTSQVGHGTVFKIYLPLFVSQDTPTLTASPKWLIHNGKIVPLKVL